MIRAALILCAALCAGCGDSSEGGPPPRVTGTLTLPGMAAGKPYEVRFYSAIKPPLPAPAASTSGLTTGSTKLSYKIQEVPAGTYFLLAFVDVDQSGGDSSTRGDYRGWYGHMGDGNPPPAANASIAASGTFHFDFSLVLAP